MVLFQSIIQDLQDLPPPILLKAAQYIRQLNPKKKKKNRLGLLATAGCLSGKEGEEFERAVREEADRIDKDDFERMSF